jgi:dUTPase
MIKVKKLSKIKETEPAENDVSTGGVLLKSTFKGRIPGHSTAVIKTGVSVEIPKNYFGLILDSDNLIKDYKLTNKIQTIPNGHKDEISVYLINTSPYPEPVDLNQIIAKVVLIPIQEK